VLAWLSVWSEVQTAYSSADATATHCWWRGIVVSGVHRMNEVNTRRARYIRILLFILYFIASCFSKVLICFTFLVPAHLGSPGKRAVKRVCVCVQQ